MLLGRDAVPVAVLFLAAAAALAANYARARRTRRRRTLLRVYSGDVAAISTDAGSDADVGAKDRPASKPVPIRGRANLPSGDSPLLPETIGPPTSADFPLVVLATDAARSAGIEACAREAYAMLHGESLLNRHGAVLLRGLPLATPDDFATFCNALGWTSNKLGGGGTVRTVLAGTVRTASDEPPEHTIEPHMDMAHNGAYPARIGFMMLHGPPAGCGGETVLVDMRLVTRDMEAQGVAAAFAKRGGVLYRKKLWSERSVSHSFTWQRRFFAAKREEVEAQLPAAGAHSWRWTPEDALEFENTLPATITHPDTRETLWFNGIHTNHRDYFDLAPHIDTTDGSPLSMMSHVIPTPPSVTPP